MLFYLQAHRQGNVGISRSTEDASNAMNQAKIVIVYILPDNRKPCQHPQSAPLRIAPIVQASAKSHLIL